MNGQPCGAGGGQVDTGMERGGERGGGEGGGERGEKRSAKRSAKRCGERDVERSIERGGERRGKGEDEYWCDLCNVQQSVKNHSTINDNSHEKEFYCP